MMKFMRWLKILGCMALSLLATTPSLSASPVVLAEADALLKSPSLDVKQAEKGLILYERVLFCDSSPRPVVLGRLARTCYILGTLDPKKYCVGHFRKGKVYAQTLIQEAPKQTEGHYWLALNLCGLAEACGYMEARRLLPQILDALNQVVVLDETYDQAGAHRVLGRIYFQAPAWPMSVGDLDKSLEHLNAAVRLAPENSTNHLYLAQTLYRLRFTRLAQQQLEQVLQCTQYAIKRQDLEEDQQEARRLLAELGGEELFRP